MAVSQEVSSSTGTKLYIKFLQRNLKRSIREHGQLHRSLECTVDPGNFVCDPSKIIPRVFDDGFDGWVNAGIRAVEVESDGR